LSDIKVKLERLKKEKSIRSRSEQVKKNWSEISQESGLSTKEKLEQLLNLQREAPVPKPPKPPKPDFQTEPREPFQFLENPYSLEARYGSIKVGAGLDIKGETLACLSKEKAFEDLDLSTALFLDLETTGLSGGTGVIPFLIGLGYYREDKFRVVQYFLNEIGEEAAMLTDFTKFIEDMNFQSIVTYNGKVFDVPLLETRFVINRLPFPLNGLPHLDFLFPARRLWSHKYDNCRLYTLALELVGTGRTEDIPSADIPWRYFQYIQTGDYDLVEPIIYHNAEDILSLLGVIIMGASIMSEDPDVCPADGMDYFGAGKVMESAGDKKKSLHFFQKALAGNPSEDVTLSVKRRLSVSHKKNEDWEKAVKFWKEVSSVEVVTRDVLFSYRELAMFYEHREKDYEEARRIAEEGMVASFHISAAYENDFRHRLERLKEKIKKPPKKKDRS